MNINNLLLLLLSISLAACSTKSNNSEHTHTPLTIQQDSIQNVDTTKLSAKIIREGFYHGDEVWDDITKDTWFGIFTNGHDFYLKKCTLKTTRCIDDAMEEDSTTEKTGWNIKTTEKDSSILLISGLSYLHAGNIKLLNLSQKQLLPNESISIQFLGKTYRLYATGIKQQDKNNPTEYQISNYKLYISTIKKGQQITTLLVKEDSFDDAMITILFGGDIDKDGFLDLLIDTSNHYNAESPTLFLSSPSDDKTILKAVANHVRVGC